MLQAFILGVALLAAVLLGLRWYVGADVQTLKKALKWLGLTVVMIGVAWLALTGKLIAALAALPAVLLWFLRLATGLRYAQMFSRLMGLGGAGRGWSNPNASGGAGQGSDVHTRFVRVHLDHATGFMSGEVLDGRCAGRRLEDLNLEEVLALLVEAQSDPDSVRVLESYLDRRDPQWRARRYEQPAAAASGMSREEALKVLGLKDGATPEEIKAAHRRLMANVHPDKGGSDYLAQQINQAKDVLLGPKS